MPITLPTGVHLRGSTFHLRIGVPDDIRHLWPRREGGSEAINAFRASLRTSSRNEAAIRAHQIIAQYHTKFETLRQSMAPKPLAEVSDALVGFMTHEVRRHILAADENATFYSDTAEQRELARGAFQRFGRVSRVAMVNGDLEPARRFAEGVAADLKVAVDWQSPSARSALVKIARAIVKAWIEVDQRQQGEPIETPPPQVAPAIATPPAPSDSVPSTTKSLRDIVTLWRQHSAPSDNAIQRTARALALFEEAVGVVPLRSLEKSHGAAFVRYLKDSKARAFAAKTAYNHASSIRALMTIAEREGLVDRDPFDLTIDKSVGSEKREPWHDEELKAMFGSALFACTIPHDYPTWRDVTPQDGRALLLMLAHTGARIGEIAQLRGEDFIVRNGIEAIRITAEAGTVKTDASERVIPLAAHLLNDAWFAAWLEGAREVNGPALPSMCGRSATPGDVAGRWFRVFRAAIGLPSGGLNGAHRFRHWIRTQLAAQHVTDAVADQITGHSAKGSAGRTVYTGVLPLATLKEALDRLPFPHIGSEAK